MTFCFSSQSLFPPGAECAHAPPSFAAVRLHLHAGAHAATRPVRCAVASSASSRQRRRQTWARRPSSLAARALADASARLTLLESECMRRRSPTRGDSCVRFRASAIRLFNAYESGLGGLSAFTPPA
eukprot:6201387-Pleurochrysis_carterae.AAC.2